MNIQERDYWNSIYKEKGVPDNPSGFALFVGDYFKNLSLNCLDCGCGNGRDSYFFGHNHINVHGIDTSNKPEDNKNVTFELTDFCRYNKSNYNLIYSRFTFHSITNEQQQLFLSSIIPNSFLCIETRSIKTKHIEKVYGDNHYRNYTNKDDLIDMLKQHNFDILFIVRKYNFAKYKNEDPICIRVICKKL